MTKNNHGFKLPRISITLAQLIYRMSLPKSVFLQNLFYKYFSAIVHILTIKNCNNNNFNIHNRFLVIEIIYGRGKFVGDFNMGNIICANFMQIMLPILKSPTNLPLP
jgi:hypothetical protein